MTTTTKTTPADRERAMFGCTLADLNAFVAKYVGGDANLFADRKAAALSLLSDAQEEMAMGLTDRARQTINRAKWLINEG
jgi:hypothetical protein